MEWITKNEVYVKLDRWVNTSESYWLHRHEGRAFSQVGINYRDRKGVHPLPIFNVYTGNQELYLRIREIVHEVVDELNRLNELNHPFVFDEWQDINEPPTSRPIVTDPSDRGRTTGVCCGAGVSETCPDIIGDPQGQRFFWVP